MNNLTHIPTREDYYADPELAKVYSLPGKDVNYGPTPELVIDKLLDLLHIGKDSVVLDPGCGDGRILIKAAQRGAMGIGIESCHERWQLAKQLCERIGNITLWHADFRDVRVEFTHMVCFMWPGVVEQVVEHAAMHMPQFTVASFVHCPWPGERESKRHELVTGKPASLSWPVFVYEHKRPVIVTT